MKKHDHLSFIVTAKPQPSFGEQSRFEYEELAKKEAAILALEENVEVHLEVGKLHLLYDPDNLLAGKTLEP